MPEKAPDSTPDAVPEATEAKLQEPTGSGPLILFDGVCNLCHAAVSWVIERDRRKIFRFASLQSSAARSALAASPEGTEAEAQRPDSIVLIDQDGAHYRSDAAIRIGRALGFPWSLAGIGALLPRPLRDGLYDRIARNRYRWFGRQNACLIPTAELRSRFLDADEPPVVLPEALPSPALAGEGRRATSLGAIGAAWLNRFVLFYFFFVVFPFPVGIVPYVSKLAVFYAQGSRVFITWVAQAVFGITIEHYPAGSGDTTYNYIEVATNLTLVLVATLLWTLVRRGAPVSERVRDGMRTYLRYYLATILLAYGWDKVIPLQMPAPGPDRLLMPIGEASPMGLLWTFLGASPAYQSFAGLGEVVAGVLLFWRRTTQLGALVATAVLANVVTLNFCYDVPVKLFSSHLFLMSLFLLAPHAARLFNILILNLPAQPVPLRPFPFRRAWMRRSALALKAVVFVLVGFFPAFNAYQALKTMGPLTPPAPLQGTYRVESFTRGGVVDRANEDAVRWVRLGLAGYAGTIQRADGTAVRLRLKVDETKRTLTFTRREAPNEPIVLRYSELKTGLVRIEGTFEGAATSALVRRQTEEKSLLMTRGFHWINEVPLNR